MKPRLLHVVLGHNPFNGAEALRGLATALQGSEVWIRPTESPAPPPRGSVDGVVLMRSDPVARRRLSRLDVPTVALFDRVWWPRYPVVVPDDAGIGRIAARFFAEHSYRVVAFHGPSEPWSEARRVGFREESRRLGLTVIAESQARSWADAASTEALRGWCEGLPTPVGVLCGNDGLACAVRNVALSAGRRIPEDIGIIGVDNDELRSGFGPVPITSIDRGGFGIGLTAGRLVRDLLNGATPPTEPIVCPPGRLVPRRSTDATAVGDPEVRHALMYIRQHLADGIDVEDVLNHVAISRSSLDRRMKATIGRTCSDEIERARLQLATEMLVNGNDSISEISAACGYHYLSHFSHAFRRSMGVTPREFRAKHRLARP